MAYYIISLENEDKEEYLDVECEVVGEFIPYREATYFQPSEGGYAEDIDVLFSEDFTFNGKEYKEGQSIYDCKELHSFLVTPLDHIDFDELLAEEYFDEKEYYEERMAEERADYD